MPEVAESFSTPEIASTIEERILVGGRFRVEELLGKGAMGVVYRAHDERTDRPVALKRMLTAAEGAPKNATALFEREFHFLSELDHPCIVSVFDYGVDESGAYYTMELLEGSDLRERGKLPWKEACALLRDVASALGILHSRRLLHCDLSTRNVRATGEGRAKLIDFGTMAPMGVPKMIAGTPPFLAPEVLHWQALDGRADLFSLGALAYYMLTGSHAFPARSLGDLPRSWDSGFRSPAEREPDVPESLSELVVELLRVDRAARPQNAAAVIERLCAIAGLPRDERSEIREAYLAMPALVGREAAVAEVRSALEASRHTAVVIEGEAGMGRSRFLDACVLDARVAGASVLRVSADDGGGSDYGVARVIAAQLIRDLPQIALRAAKPWRSVLAHVSDDLAARPASVPPGAPVVPERRHIQTALRDWLLAIARERWVVLAVDDFDAIDEPSAAFLAALPHHEGYRELSLLVTTQRATASPALRMIQAVARRIDVGPLSAEATEALTRSIFGDVENVALVARSMHDLAGGNPRSIMEIAEHLVGQRIAHFEAGSWVLPRKLDASRVPSVVSLARIDALSATARELFEVLSLADASTIALADYPALLQRDVGQTYHALTELVATGILVQAGDAYRIGHRGLADRVSSQIESRRKRALNARLSRLKEQQGDPFGQAHHLLEAGEARRAVEVVRAHRKARVFALRPGAAALLERVVEESRAIGLPRTETMSLTIALVGVTALLGDHERFARHAPPLLAQLKRDSGLDDWHDLATEGVPEGERLMRAFERCAARRDATPAHDRGFDGQRAFAMLARVSSSFSGMAMVSMDASIMQRLPSFLPFGVLSPAIAVLDESLVAARDFLTCHGARAREHALSVVARLDEPDRAGLDETASRALRYAMLYMLGAMDAFDGRPNALEHVAEFENTPGYRGNAWRVRRVAHLMQGNFEAAEECHRRAELFELLDGHEQVFPGTVIRIEASAHWMVGDLAGLKEAIERITEIVTLYPAWQSTLDMARSHYLRLQGHADAALEALQPALRRSSPGADPDWVWVTAAHVLALTAAGRYEEASRLGREYFATARREELSPPMRCLVKPLAEALARAGHLDEAQVLCDEALAELEADRVRGLWLGSLYEARAFVAIMRGDEAAFERDAALCAAEYRRGKNSTLVANYERLMREAARRALRVPEKLAHAAERGSSTTTTHAEQGAVMGSVAMRIAACQNASERAHAVLVTLMEHSGADAGYLYRLRAGRPECSAAVPSDAPVPEGVDSFVERYVRERVVNDDETMSMLANESAVGGAREAQTVTTQAGVLIPVTLATFHEGEPVLVAVGMLRLVTGSKPPKLELLDRLARLLVQHGDIDEPSAS